MTIYERLRRWYFGRYREEFTIACDRSPFWSPINEREELFHATGRAKARRIAKRWVREHPYGQARVLFGHVEWEKNDYRESNRDTQPEQTQRQG